MNSWSHLPTGLNVAVRDQPSPPPPAGDGIDWKARAEQLAIDLEDSRAHEKRLMSEIAELRRTIRSLVGNR